MEIIGILQYGFIQRALVAGIFIAVVCSILGVFLVLRRLSLIGDGLSHAAFGSVALAMFVKATPMLVAVPFVMCCAVGILRLTERVRIFGDAAIGVVSAAGVALGVLLAALAGGFNVDLFSYLFGSILAIDKSEAWMAVIMAAAVILLVTCFYNELLAVTFDEDAAQVSGIEVTKINTIFVLLTAVAVVLSMKLVGVMLISALLIIPAVTALQVATSFRGTLAMAAAAAVLSVIIGIFTAFHFDVPAGATIVVINIAFFILTLLWRRGRHGRV